MAVVFKLTPLAVNRLSLWFHLPASPLSSLPQPGRVSTVPTYHHEDEEFFASVHSAALEQLINEPVSSKHSSVLEQLINESVSSKHS